MADERSIGLFLDFLDRDIAAHPERLQALDPQFVEYIRALVGDIEIDLDAPLPEEDEDSELGDRA